MTIFRKYTFIALALTALFAGRAVGQVQVFAQIDSQKDIYVGESFTYYIIIEGADKQGQADLGPLQKYNPQSTGSRNQSSTQIINGKITQNITTIMTYALTADRPELIQLPSVTVTIDGKTYRTNPVTVNIIKPGTTDKLELDITLSEKQCYVGQPIVLTVKFYRYANIGDYQFNIPVLNSDAFYIEEPDDTTSQTKQYRITKGGRDAILFTFSKILIPKHAGKIDIKPASISAELVVGRSRSRDRFFDDFFSSGKQYKRFMVSSEPLSLDVLPLPEQGKPDGFYGLVGRYTISASAKPTTDVYMGDPITLTIKIAGSKYLKPVHWPELQQVPELAANFKMPSQKAAPAIDNGFKVFTQTIRPDNNKANVIPSIPLAYFDPDTASYNVAKTKPIKLDLKPSKRLTYADIEGRDFAPVNKEVEAIKKGLSANYESPDVLENMNFSPAAALISPGYAPIWTVPLAILILSSVTKFLTCTNPEKVAAKRRRQACSKAIAQLKKITSIDSSQRNEQIASIMKQYIGDRFDKIVGSLTGNDCYEAIVDATEDTEAANEYRRTIERCQSTRYASIDVNIDSRKTDNIIELIRNIEKKLKK
ncbi:MAG: BatD family protein [Sedimentisphaerales bacterium]|nr:BatD family protein [Sedimentisphaerales bacterium]